jgi:predicted permease
MLSELPMHTLLQDFRFTLRQLRKNPGFALTTILTLALGIGATTSIFSLVNAVLLRPLPFPESGRLVSMQPEVHSSGTVNTSSLSYPDFFDWRSQGRSFSGIASFHDTRYTLSSAGDAQNIEGEVVSSVFFHVLGIHPELGRDFAPADEKPGQRVVMLSHQLWQSTFGSRPDIAGQSIVLDGKGYSVAGVMPASFSFPVQNPAPQLWMTLAVDALNTDGSTPPTQSRGMNWLESIARLKPGVTVEQARAEMNTITQNLAVQYPETNKRSTSARVIPELENLVGDASPALRILFAAVGFVLLIACANVAGLLLARASSRNPEIALRAALGSGRAGIVRQMMVESLTLSLLGGIFGLAFAALFLQAMLHFIPQRLPRLDNITIDATVLAFTTLISVFTGLLFGVFPAWRMSRLDPALALREGTRSVTGGRRQNRLHSALVIGEIALGLLLLVGSGLFLRSFLYRMSVNPGFDKHNVLTARVNYPDTKDYANKVTQLYDQFLPRLAALPGVTSAAAGWPLPFSGSQIGISFDIEGRPTAPGDRRGASATIVTPNFFNTMRIPILHGRDFTPADAGKAPDVVIVSEGFAHKFFPNEDPIGKHIKPGVSDGVHPEVMRQIIAVVGDVRQASLVKDAPPMYYLPLAQAGINAPDIVLRTGNDPTTLIAPVRAQMRNLDRSVPLYQVHTLDDMLSDNVSQPRFQVVLLASFAAMALLLSAVGLYAVLSYLVSQRVNEIGLRLALGAQRGDVLRLILKRGLSLAGIGLVAGLAASAGLTRLISSQLFGVRSFDALTYSGVTVLMILISLAASAAPALRASNVDPMKTLRDQ